MSIFYDLLCGGLGKPAFYLHFLVFETLVVGKEIRGSGDPVRIKIAQRLVFAHMAHRNAHDLVVLVAVVGHIQHCDRFHLHQCASLERNIIINDDVEWVVVKCKSLRDEPIGRRVAHGAVEAAIQSEDIQILVVLVFGVCVFRNLNDAVDNIRTLFSDRDSVYKTHLKQLGLKTILTEPTIVSEATLNSMMDIKMLMLFILFDNKLILEDALAQKQGGRR